MLLIIIHLRLKLLIAVHPEKKYPDQFVIDAPEVNYSKINNDAAAYAKEDYILFLIMTYYLRQTGRFRHYLNHYFHNALLLGQDYFIPVGIFSIMV